MQTKKIKKIAITVIMALAFLSACVKADAQNSWLTLHAPARNLVYPEKVKRETSFLADSICNGRGTGTPGNMEAGAWISRKFREAGLMRFDSTWAKSFTSPNGTIGRNILGFLPGSSKRHPEKYVIVAAHYDHIGNINGRMFPGADANASGVVAMTSLADMVSMTKKIGRSYIHNVIFVGLDGKEMDMAGSKALLDMITDGRLTDPISGKVIGRKDILMMVNIDQIGSSMSPLNETRKDYLIMLDGTRSQNSHKSALKTCNTRYDVNLDLGFTYYGSDNFTRLFYSITDQKVFSEKGIPAIMFTSGITMNNNKTWDNVASLDMDVFIKRIYLMYHWLLMII